MKKRTAWLMSMVFGCVSALSACGQLDDESGRREPANAATSSSAAARSKPARATIQLSRLPFVASVATFSPRRPRAWVSIQRWDGAVWRTAISGRQSRAGTFAFALSPTTSIGQKYRAVSVSGRGGRLVSRVATPSTRWRKVWGDEFAGTRLDPGKWRTRVQEATGRRQCATPGPALVHVRSGQAVLGIRRVGGKTRACPHGVFKNAMIGTGEPTPGFSARYGLFAARLKFQAGRGQHGAFWMQAAESGGAEIDVAEYFGDHRSDGGISSFIHKTSSTGALTSVGGNRRSVKKLLGKRRTPSSGWHVWSVEWYPGGYVFRMDGHVTMRTSKARVAVREYVVLSLLTSDWELPALNTTTSTMKVDWVRAWQH
ncbi:family 16 glycosylhydrolase [Marmoricola sp. URHB0036]|uniref:glycoside hydrolase family 16 protein n=1 Tax=Marmoricola sp. URHB0036 TaxID=1298863 RepID=UPI00041223FB|nr:glycoside hydrolase family 16 protein [Marmoricola sp. URHB0036]